MSLVNRLISNGANTAVGLAVRKRLRRLMEAYYNAAVVDRLATKVRPLPLVITGDAPSRINLVIPEINFDSFFGGYIAKFNLARLLAAAGRRVRIITVDPCTYEPAVWRARIGEYAGLADFFDRIEVQCCYARTEPVSVSPRDVFVATTWWTAYIAHDAVQQLGRERFLYLIQEYEPFTFPMGSYFAMARSSYDLPHFAAFSTQLLQDFFVSGEIGVFDDADDADDADGAQRAVYFENAILSYTECELKLVERSPRRLLFYARPEAHAARNMFEIGYIALARAIEQGVFAPGEWEFFGIGSGHSDLELPQGERLNMIGKLGLAEYRAALPGFDLGISLMYTPHPSLLPLEMAAAGMPVVTNECLNKTHQALQAISPNLIGAPPTIDGVVDGLRRAVTASADLAARRAGARVRWAIDWEQAFDVRFLNTITNWLEI